VRRGLIDGKARFVAGQESELDTTAPNRASHRPHGSRPRL